MVPVRVSEDGGGLILRGGNRLDLDDQTRAPKTRDVEDRPGRKRLGYELTFHFSEFGEMRAQADVVGDEID